MEHTWNESFDAMEDYGFGPDAMKQVKVCPKCRSLASAGQTRCSVCGSRLPRKTLFQQYRRHHVVCPVCDTILPASCQYCPQCGTRQKTKFWKKLLQATMKHGL